MPPREVDLVSQRGFKATVIASAAVLAAFMSAGAPALASPAATAGAASPASPTAPAGGSARVMLITGDVVTVSKLPGGRQTASVVKAHPKGAGGQFQMFSRGPDLYVVPQSAVPYLGSTLSLSLFDVTRLARQEKGTSSLAVKLRLRTSSGGAVVPGITVTHRSGMDATGRLSEASARRFGAMLARQAQRDHASADHVTGLFAHVARIAPAGATVPAAPRARPDFPMFTLTLNGINPAGQKDNGDLVLVYNVDNLRKYTGEAVFGNGRAKISVPTGHYTAICFFFNFTTGAVAEAMLPQFTVSGNASVTLDGRDSTAPVSVHTPRPANPVITEVAIGRADRLGQVSSYSFLGSGQTSFTAEPMTRRISVGQLYYYVYSRLFSPASAKTLYSYDLEFPSTGAVPANQNYVAQAGSLATIRSAYPATQTGQSALETRFGALPWQSFLFASDVTITTPMQRTEYYTARPDLSWEGVYYAVFDQTSFTLQSEIDSSWTAYQPGVGYATTWGGQPEHPRLLQTDLFPGTVYCPACVSGQKLNLLAFPFSDNSAEHRSYPDGPATGLSESESYDVYADGVAVTKGTGFLQKTVSIPAGTHDVRIDYDTTRSSPVFTLSTRVATRWTVRTSAPTGGLPSGWFCDFLNHTKCGVLPLMTADYGLPVNMLGQLSPGSVTGSVDVSHLAGSTDVAVNSLSVAVSFNGGTSWHKAAITDAGSGRYTVTFTVPAASSTSGFGSLRLRAADAYGGTFSQTIQNAFAVAAS
jgi:hypothetical protein